MGGKGHEVKNKHLLLQECFLFLQGKRQMIGIEHIKALADCFVSACLRIDELTNTRSYLWANRVCPAKAIYKLKKHGQVAIGRN